MIKLSKIAKIGVILVLLESFLPGSDVRIITIKAKYRSRTSNTMQRGQARSEQGVEPSSIVFREIDPNKLPHATLKPKVWCKSLLMG